MSAVKTPSFSAELQAAITIAREAGEKIMEYYRRGGYRVERKSDDTPVTEADKAANDLIVRELWKRSPYPILSEESADDPARLASECVWLVDPLDGTKGFVRGEKTFSVLIGLARDGRPVLGAAYFPASDLLYAAEEGKGAWRSAGGGDFARFHTIPPSDPREAILIVGSGGREDTPVLHAGGFTRVVYASGFGTRIIAVATGDAHAHVNLTEKGSEWDACAPEIILREAGGILTDAKGNALAYNKPTPAQKGGIIAAASAAVHAVALEEIVPILRREG